MDQSAPIQNQVTCVQCQAVTTNDGRTVWVCENCQTVNQPSLEQLVATPSAVQPIVPQPPLAPDVTSAQAELDQAAQAAAATPIPETPATLPPSPNPTPSV